MNYSPEIRATKGVLRPWRAKERARTPVLQCGTGDLARQIAESGLEIGQTPGAGVPARGSLEAKGFFTFRNRLGSS